MPAWSSWPPGAVTSPRGSTLAAHSLPRSSTTGWARRPRSAWPTPQRACDLPMSSPRPSSGRRLHQHAETIPKSRSLYHIERRRQPVSNLTPSRFLRATMSRPSSRLRSEVISQALSLSWKTARATGSRSSTWSVWNRAWRTMQVRAIRTTPKRGLSWFQKSAPKRFNWPCRIYGTRGTSI